MQKGTLTRSQIRADIAKLLDVPPEQLVDDKHLVEQGMDSIRLMTLVERWREHRADIDFITLAEEPTVERWSKLFGETNGDLKGKSE
ncbi:phosphopantetheine-binding protein [Hyalangium versicolor]|uniref:phosphopantetheine-binding protein n=1 Tax=Hyalangium versicolor TaxID=2861190 RepID=UPI001CCF2796|nr:phosphopantetheine-binding protein [Hyalangium versicolor]